MTGTPSTTAERTIKNLRGTICVPIAGPLEHHVKVTRDEALRIAAFAAIHDGVTCTVDKAMTPAQYHLVQVVKTDDMSWIERRQRGETS